MAIDSPRLLQVIELPRVICLLFWIYGNEGFELCASLEEGCEWLVVGYDSGLPVIRPGWTRSAAQSRAAQSRAEQSRAEQRSLPASGLIVTGRLDMDHCRGRDDHR